MRRFVRPLGLAGALVALGLAIPAVVLAADPNANNDGFDPVQVVNPTVLDVLANDTPGDATATRPLTIVNLTAPAHGSVRTNGRVVYYDPADCYTGIDTFTYTVSDGSGPTDTAVVGVNVARPLLAPTTAAPQAGFVKGSTLGSTVPVKVSWCAAISSGTILQAYRLTESTDGGATFGSALLNSAATSTTRNAKLNTSYAWQVRTTDGRSQSTNTSLVSRVTRFQEKSGSITYSSGWKTASSKKYSGRKERYAAKKGARATLTTSNVRQFAIVASKGPGRGKFNVFVDGVKVTSSPISQRAGKAAYRRVLYVGSIAASGGTHTIQVRTTNGDRVDLDAILTLSGKSSQVLAFTDTAGPRTYHDDAWTAAATTDSGLPVVLTLTEASWPACALDDDGEVTFHGVGTCTIVANQYGDPTWNATSVSQVITVAKAPVTVSGITAQDRTFIPGDSSAAIDTSGAQLNGVFGEDAAGVTLVTTGATGSFADPSAGQDRTVTISGLTLTGTRASLYAITQPTTTASIAKASQTITFTSTAPVGAEVGDPAYEVSAVATSGLQVTFSIDGASSSVCALTGNDVTFTGAGTCTVIASQSGNANWLVAMNATQSFSVTGGTLDPQTIAFGPLDDAVYGDDPITLSATATSGLTVQFESQTTAVCTTSGTTLTIVAAGECTVRATQPGNGTWAAATPVDRSLTVDPKTLGVTGITADDRPYDTTTAATPQLGSAALTGVEGGDTVTLVTAGATGAFASAGAGAGKTVTVSGLALAGADAANYQLGTVTTTASITKRNLTVTADDQTIAFGDPDPAFTFTYGAFAGSETAAVIDTPPTCGVPVPERDVEGSPYPITCSGGADDNYAFTYVDGELTVTQAEQEIAFTTVAPATAPVGGTYVPAATATSGLQVTFTVQSPMGPKCSIAAGTVTFLAEGECRVRADQAGNADYQQADQVRQVVDVVAP